MEFYAPPTTPEQAPGTEPSPKKRWNIFELFNKKENESEVPKQEALEKADKKDTKSEAKQSGEKQEALPERRGLGAALLKLLSAEQSAPEDTELHVPRKEKPLDGVSASQEVELKLRPQKSEQTAELPPTAEVVSAATPEQPVIVERAKHMGQRVLQLIRMVRSEVRAADKTEEVETPTDLQPLAEADQDVRAAMQELIAPIVAYEADTQPPVSVEAEAASVAPEAKPVAAEAEPTAPAATPDILDTVDMGGDASPLARTYAVAAAVAEVTAREALQTKERSEKIKGAVRKVGLLALGAATAGGFAYTWYRMRQLRKEQREMRKEHKRFEAEVRQHQAAEEQRLHKLEETSVVTLTQPERQQFVQNVSEFAHEQADEIRTVAHATTAERAAAAPAAVQRTQEQSAASMPQPASTERQLQSERTGAILQHAEPIPSFELPKERKVAAPEKPVVSTERGGLIERLNNVVTSGKKRVQEGGLAGVGGGVAAAGGRLVDALAAKAQPLKQAITQPATPQAPVKKPTQAWLLGVALAAGIIVAILVIVGL